MAATANSDLPARPMIALRNLVKSYRVGGQTLRALDDVTLHVPPGKILGVIGSSGAGKSTLIRCVNLLERPESGLVEVEGVDLTSLGSAALAQARRQIGMVFQHFNLLSSRTVFENIALPLELAGYGKRDIAERVGELLDLIGLKEKASDYPASLSGGQKQRVAIARTLAPSPSVLLCDEATSALDPGTTRSILGLLQRINERLGITILLITHEMDVVKAICHEVAVIEGGRLVEQGSVSEVFARPQSDLTQRFLETSMQVPIPVEYRDRSQIQFDEASTLLRLQFSGASNDAPLLSDLYRLFEVSTNIVNAQMECHAGVKFGGMLVELSGEQRKQGDAVDYLRQHQVKAEVLGYV